MGRIYKARWRCKKEYIMDQDSLKRHYIQTMAKHLPPSASNLRLLDINGQAGDFLIERRGDLDVQVISIENLSSSSIEDNTLDSVVGYDIALDTPLLNFVLKVMRQGGRFIAVLSDGKVSETYVKLLENHGYIRILVEPAIDGLGVLIRGEKAHTTEDTFERIQQVADTDGDMLDLETFRGRYVHLLVRQLPNKPVWKLESDEKLEWQAVAIERAGQVYVLGFSSLPKAVGFMQPAVLEGIIQDINKVGKFSKQTASEWTWNVLLNPTLESIRDSEIKLIAIDPNTAEASDE